MFDQQVHERRILVVDDNQAIHEDFSKVFRLKQVDDAIDRMEAELFGTTFEPSSSESIEFKLDFASQGIEALEFVQRRKDDNDEYCVAFVDMRMPPGWDGVTTIEELWKVDPQLNVVICTAYSDYSWEEIVGRLGVTDRLLILKKPFDKVEVMQMAMTLSEKKLLTDVASYKLNELRNIVEMRTESLQTEIRERRAMEQELIRARNVLEHQASHDTVTDLWNRRAIISIFDESLKVNRQAQRPTSLMFADVDHFKSINDTYGHVAGDAVLAEVGRRLKSVLRKYDDVGRYGGEEFLVVLPACDRDVAPSIGNRVCEVIRSQPILVGDDAINVTISVGVTTSGEQDRFSQTELLQQSDAALYEAKEAGRDCVRVAGGHSSGDSPVACLLDVGGELNVR
ncbi:MAG: diguanylate cyclase [Planctomycetota bacterium]